MSSFDICNEYEADDFGPSTSSRASLFFGAQKNRRTVYKAKRNAKETLFQEIQEHSHSEEDFQDSGSEYHPNEGDHRADRFTITIANDIVDNNGSSDENRVAAQIMLTEDPVQNNSRKRRRNEAAWKKNVKKLKRARGEEYETESGRTVLAKKPCLDDNVCLCKNKCAQKILVAQRTTIFNNFYGLSSYDLQNSFLTSLVDIVAKARLYTNSESSRRKRSCFYFAPDNEGQKVRVCKTFFLKLFQVSDGRVSRLIQYKARDITLHVDRRGRSVSGNKTKREKLEELREFIKKFPAYESHYTRHKSERKYLSPDLNIVKMYNMYKDSIESPVSEYVFRKTFNIDFNLSFHVPIKDSCKKCDIFNNNFKFANDSEKSKIKIEHDLHLNKADSARNGMKDDAAGAKESDDTSVIAFDLMKTLPTPVLTTGVCYYKRQLWTYCLGIHDLVKEKAYMYVWDESVGSRGPQEIGSCLLHFIKNFVSTPNLIMYTDQCGGQNRNIKMSVLCQFFVSHTDLTVKQIDHKFLLSGHSYLPCDQDFGLIEKQKRYFQDIFGPKDWHRVILAARKKDPFKLIVMDSAMMFSTKTLECNITNRKVNSHKGKVEWLKIQWLRFLQDTPFNYYYKYSNDANDPFETVTLKKRTSILIEKLVLLFPTGNKVSEAKKKDLLDLINFIPPLYHEFYTTLKTIPTDRDVGLVEYIEEDPGRD